jgi:hypothetical protein
MKQSVVERMLFFIHDTTFLNEHIMCLKKAHLEHELPAPNSECSGSVKGRSKLAIYSKTWIIQNSEDQKKLSEL